MVGDQLITKVNQDWIDRIHSTPVNDNWFTLVDANPNPMLKSRKEYEEIAKDFEIAYSTIDNSYEFGKKNLGYLGEDAARSGKIKQFTRK